MMGLRVNEEGRVSLCFRPTRGEFDDGSSIAGEEVRETIFIVPTDEGYKFTDAVAFVEATMALDTEKYHPCPLVVLIEELVKQGIQNYVSLVESKGK